ncbi:hypothetical protein HUS23_00455 [Ectothiorhodospiraceae bacterium 2226]|nr:hypothetical protein HUS23_00455 [Ectothiorhodospiraceae bacterium 2226]
MDPDARLLKTAKGEEEIKRRTHGLPKDERLALILVDGRSTAQEVMRKAAGAPNLKAALVRLAEQGFIQVIESKAAGGYGDIKQSMIAIAREVFGDNAGKVVAKIEAATESREGLAEGVVAARKIAQLLIDEGKARDFATRCQALLDAN